MGKLDGKVALVTGASRGLGRAMAIRLAREGAAVGVNYFGSAELAARVVGEINSGGGRAMSVWADVRDEAEVERMVGEVTGRFGLIDVLVINATGPQPFIRIEDLTWRACLDQLEFFVKSPVLLVKAVLGEMKARGSGRIINIGSEVFER